MNNRAIKITAAVVAVIAVGIMTPLAWAWACTSLATVDLKPAAGLSGSEVTGVGYGFDPGVGQPGQAHSGDGAGDATVEAVEVRWNSASGPLLAKVIPDADGTVKFTFKAPAGAPGYYTVIASQKTTTGEPVAGTPARASYALNNPPKQAVSGAELAGTLDQETAGRGGPSGIVHHQQQVADDPAVFRPAEPIRAAVPSGSRSRDVFGLASSNRTSVGAQLGLLVMGLGAATALAAVATVSVTHARRAKQRI